VRNATGKSCQKLCTGEVLPLDKSLLMGGFSDLQSQQVWVRISGWHPMKALQYKELIKTLRPCCIVLSLPSFGQPVQKA
jgi:hypothetical protein